MRITRAERLRQIRDLQAKGLRYREIAERLEITTSNVRNILYDPDGSKQRARRVRYQGVCVDCGGPTDGSSGREKAPTRCASCTRGEEPRLSRPSRRRRLAVRLCDLPVEVRLEGARAANRWESGQYERTEILMAALFPSEQVYWINEGALSQVDALMAAAA